VTYNRGSTLSTNILFRNKFRKRGRTFSLNLLTNINSSEGRGSNQAITKFYTAYGAAPINDSFNQKNNNAAALKGFNARAVYTEPIFKKSLLELSAGRSYTDNNAAKTTFDYNRDNGKFDLVNNVLTNNFDNLYGYTSAGLRLRNQTSKYIYAVGASWQQAKLEGLTSNDKGSMVAKKFTDILPNARFQYRFSRYKHLTLNYITNTNQPTITQLQPLPDNSNPLYIRLGNPELQQELIHSLSLNANFVNPFKNRTLFGFINFQKTQNKIVNYDNINSFGVDSVRPVNVNGVYNINGNLSFGLPVPFLKGSVNIRSRINKYHGIQFLNTLQNVINTLTIGPQIRLDINPTDKLNFSFAAEFNHSKTNYSLAFARQSKYFTQDYSADVIVQLPKSFFIATNFNYSVINQYTSGFDARVPLWNTSISKQVLHFNRGELKLSVRDILDKNIGINRNANQNYIEDSRVNSLRRFFLLSFTYNLTKIGLTSGDGRRNVLTN
jgi:hypothetical protein